MKLKSRATLVDRKNAANSQSWRDGSLARELYTYLSLGRWYRGHRNFLFVLRMFNNITDNRHIAEEKTYRFMMCKGITGK
jgi:hypothetical protein